MFHGAGASLGELIRSRSYDYVYQLNWPGPRPYTPAAEVLEGDSTRCFNGQVAVVSLPGNTGFYYASIRKRKLMSMLWEAALKASEYLFQIRKTIAANKAVRNAV